MDELDLTKLAEIARQAAPSTWLMAAKPRIDEFNLEYWSVGPDFEDPDGPPDDFYENTLLEVWGTEYDGEANARFVATFDPWTVRQLIEMASVREEALYEEIGTLNGEKIYRRK